MKKKEGTKKKTTRNLRVVLGIVAEIYSNHQHRFNTTELIRSAQKK